MKPVKRMPCIYKKTQLMPVTYTRAYNLVKRGRAIYVKDKKLGTYLKLKTPPSGYKTQDLSLGIDYGTMFDGYSIVNEHNSHNYELEHSRKLKDKNFIKKKTANRSAARRGRRNRLWHREARFDNRTGRKITQTMNYYYQDVTNMIESIMKLYPISHIVIEDVAAVHDKYHRSGGFSPLEQIKTRLYSYCESVADLIVSKKNPVKIREYIARDGHSYDMKRRNKAAKCFYAHCLDSHSLACLVFDKHLPYTEEMLYITRKSPGIDNIRRILSRERPSGYNDSNPPRRLSKLRKIRIKTSDSKSNHSDWIYQYTGRVITYSKKKCVYGSTVNLKPKVSKYRDGGGCYVYYDIEKIHNRSNAPWHIWNYLKTSVGDSSLG